VYWATRNRTFRLGDDLHPSKNFANGLKNDQLILIFIRWPLFHPLANAFRFAKFQLMPASNYMTLPDYLRPGLKLVFVGLNPGLYSARAGKYFARKTNRFWPALSASRFFGREVAAGDEKRLFEKGIGFTDVVKRATAQIDELTRDEITAGAQMLRRKLTKFSPVVACFIGLTGFRWVFEVPVKTPIMPGPQLERIGASRIYVLPSTSPANAHFSFGQIVEEFRRLQAWLEGANITFEI
jgi:TDG/mug DNA glycosylase family protein